MAANSQDSSALGEMSDSNPDPSSSSSESVSSLVRIATKSKMSRNGEGRKPTDGEDPPAGSVTNPSSASPARSPVTSSLDDRHVSGSDSWRKAGDSTPIAPKLKVSHRVVSSEKLLSSSRRSKSNKDGNGLIDPIAEDIREGILTGSAPDVPQLAQRKDKKRTTVDGEIRLQALQRPSSASDISNSDPAALSDSSSSAGVHGQPMLSPGSKRKGKSSRSLNSSTAGVDVVHRAHVEPPSLTLPTITKETEHTLVSPGRTTAEHPFSPTPDRPNRQSAAALLIDILRSPKHAALLRAHMKQELCDENLDFWIDAQHLAFQFQFQEHQLGHPLDPQEILHQATTVYQTYIETSAPRSLNLPSKVAGRIRHCFRNAPSAITTSIFSEAQQTAFKVIESDPFPRFIQSSRQAATDGLVQLNNRTSNSECEDFLAVLEEESARKWSKVSKSDGIKVSKRDTSGIHHIRAEAEIDAPVSVVFSIVQKWQDWSQWQRASVTTMELERFSDTMQLVYYFWPLSICSLPKASDVGDRDWILLIASKLDPTASVVTYRSIPHTTAPTPPHTTRGVALPCGWRMTPSPNDPNKCWVTSSARAEKPETKKWDKEAAAQHQSMMNLRVAVAKLMSTTS